MQYLPILQYEMRSFNIQDDRSMREFLANPLKNFQIIYGQPVLTFAERAVVVFEWTLTELRFNIIKNLLRLFFYNGFFDV